MTPELDLLSSKFASRIQTKKISLIELSENSFTLQPQVEDSFPLSVSFLENQYVIEAGRWHGHFTKVDQAFAVMSWLLTPYYRIVTSFLGFEVRATWLERYTDDGWDDLSVVYAVDPESVESPVDGADRLTIQHQAIFLDSAFRTYFPQAELDQAGYPVGTILGEVSYEYRNDGWYPVGVPEAE